MGRLIVRINSLDGRKRPHFAEPAFAFREMVWRIVSPESHLALNRNHAAVSTLRCSSNPWHEVTSMLQNQALHTMPLDATPNAC